MHEHDLDLIAAYADEALDGPERQEAARLVESCAVCRAEHRGQIAVKAWLAGAPPVSLTPTERTLLHDRLAAVTRSEATVVSLTERRSRLWMRLSTAAAALFVVAAVGGIILSLSQDGGEAFRETSAGLNATTAASTTTQELASTGAPTAAMEAGRFGADLGPLTRDELPGLLESLTDESLAEDQAGAYGAADVVLRCVETLPGEVRRSLAATVDGRQAELYVYDQDGELAADALDAETCETLLP